MSWPELPYKVNSHILLMITMSYYTLVMCVNVSIKNEDIIEFNHKDLKSKLYESW